MHNRVIFLGAPQGGVIWGSHRGGDCSAVARGRILGHYLGGVRASRHTIHRGGMKFRRAHGDVVHLPPYEAEANHKVRRRTTCEETPRDVHRTRRNRGASGMSRLGPPAQITYRTMPYNETNAVQCCDRLCHHATKDPQTRRLISHGLAGFSQWESLNLHGLFLFIFFPTRLVAQHAKWLRG